MSRFLREPRAADHKRTVLSVAPQDVVVDDVAADHQLLSADNKALRHEAAGYHQVAGRLRVLVANRALDVEVAPDHEAIDVRPASRTAVKVEPLQGKVPFMHEGVPVREALGVPLTRNRWRNSSFETRRKFARSASSRRFIYSRLPCSSINKVVSAPASAREGEGAGSSTAWRKLSSAMGDCAHESTPLRLRSGSKRGRSALCNA